MNVRLVYKIIYVGPRGFGYLGRRAIYYQGAGYSHGSGKQAQSLRDLGSPAKKKKIKKSYLKGKASISFDF